MSDRLFDLSDAELNRFVEARSKLRTPGCRGMGRKMGDSQRAIVSAAKREGLTVRGIFADITCTSMDATINTMAGLVARREIELVDGKWRAVARSDAA